VHPCEGIEIPVGLLVNVNALGDQWDCECIPDRACERTGCPVRLEMDQESIGIALVYVCVCEGNVGRLDYGFVLLHTIFYILYSVQNLGWAREVEGSILIGVLCEVLQPVPEKMKLEMVIGMQL